MSHDEIIFWASLGFLGIFSPRTAFFSLSLIMVFTLIGAKPI